MSLVVAPLLLAAALALLFGIAWFDMRHGRIHDGAVVALALTATTFRVHDASMTLSGAIAGGIIFGTLWLLGRGRWLGAGDIGLGSAVGLLCGTTAATVFAAACAFTLGALIAMTGLATGRLQRGDHLPFAPFLTAGTVVSLASWTTVAAWLAIRGW